MSTTDDLYRLRIERSNFRKLGPDLGSGGSPAFLGQVLSTGAALGVGLFAKVAPVVATGPQVAGGIGLISSGSTSVLVYQLGPAPFTTGDFVIPRFVDFRWVADRMTSSTGGLGGGGGTVPLCYCPAVPTTLTMTSLNPACNYGMFQSCTLQYGPIPSEFAPLDLGSQAFISVESFPDVIAGGALFRYYLSCQYNVFSLTRIYPTSPYGSPYIDGVLYTWYVGSYGNTCSPFHLDNGTAYQGTDGICSVTIDS